MRNTKNNNAQLNEQLAKFKMLVQEEIDTRRDKATDFRIMTSRSRFNLIRHMLACADKNKEAYEKLLQSQDMDFNTLNHLGIENFDALKNWVSVIKSQADIMLKLLHGDVNNIKSDDVLELNQVKKISHIIALLYTFAKSCGDEFPAKNELLDLIEIIRPDYVYKPYRKLIAILSSVKNQPKLKNQNESENIALDQNSERISKLEERINELTTQNNDLKAELDSAYVRINSAEEEYERLQDENSKLALIDVLAKMNSKASRKMLDQFAKSEKTLKELAAKNFQIPSEIASVSLCVRLFMSTMRSFGVSPVHELGDVIELTLNEAENYDYNGTDFNSDDEKKLVQVIDTGWKCEGIIFSRPSVVEC